MEAIRQSQRAQGTAAILAIGTASPDTCIYQQDMPDFYFRVTNTQHMTHLKDKLKRICEKSGIRKRHFFLNEEILRRNQSMCAYKAPSLDVRQHTAIEEVPKLGMVAAEKAIKQWGHPVSAITHLIFNTTTGIDLPGADFRLSRLLGLGSHVNRLMLYNNGCYAGSTLLRVAKDLAENTRGARVLAVAVENFSFAFHGPSPDHLDIILGQAIFGDGAAALVVGADPDSNTERPLFYLAATLQQTIPESEEDIRARVCEMGLSYYISRRVPELVSANVGRFVEEAFGSIGVEVGGRLESLFYVVHPGGKAILDKIEQSLGLCPEKLVASRHVMSEYGNMMSPCVLFILKEIARKSAEEGRSKKVSNGAWRWVSARVSPSKRLSFIVLRFYK